MHSSANDVLSQQSCRHAKQRAPSLVLLADTKQSADASASSQTAAANTPAGDAPADDAGLQQPHAIQHATVPTASTAATASSMQATKQKLGTEQLQHTVPNAVPTAEAGKSAANISTAVHAVPGTSIQSQSTDTDGQGQSDVGPDQACSPAQSVPCPACLGVLQSPEQTLATVPASMLAGLPEPEGNAGRWKGCNLGSAEALAACVRCGLPCACPVIWSHCSPERGPVT